MIQLGASKVGFGHGNAPPNKGPSTPPESHVEERDAVVKRYQANRTAAAKRETHLSLEQQDAVDRFHAKRRAAVDAFNRS